MKMRKLCSFLALVGLVLGMAGTTSAMSPPPPAKTLLVVPERINTVQVGFDMVNKRPVALVSYRGDGTRQPLTLHAWTDNQWRPLALEDYEGGYFLIRPPARIVLVGDERLLPDPLINASDWGPLLMSIDTTETDELLNSLGRLFEFNRSEWRWFASRYNMDIEDVTPEQEQISWYDQMTRARQTAPRRTIDDPPVTPIVPVPEPAEPLEPEPVPAPEPEPAPTVEDGVPVREAVEWTDDEDVMPDEEDTDHEEPPADDEMQYIK